MAAECCENKSRALDALRDRQTGTLLIVLGINIAMFVVEATAGWLSGSTALLSDSLDNLGDALTYALSLFAISKSDAAKARVAVLKGCLIMVAGLVVVGTVVYKVIWPATPVFEAMTGVGLLAFAANATCLALLWKHRQEDVNMSSVWECSRNDIAANLAVITAAAGVWFFNSGWPDVIVASALAALFIWSATNVLRRALSALHDATITSLRAIGR